MRMTKSVLVSVVTSFAFPVRLFTVIGHRHRYFPFVGYASLKVLLTSCDTLYQAVVARLIYSLIYGRSILHPFPAHYLLLNSLCRQILLLCEFLGLNCLTFQSKLLLRMKLAS